MEPRAQRPPTPLGSPPRRYRKVILRQGSREKRLYLDDLHVGQKFTSGTYRMDEMPNQVIRRGVRSAAVSSGRSGGAKQRVSRTGRQWVAYGRCDDATAGDKRSSVRERLVGLGGEITWPRPTRPGDTLHVESEIISITPSRSKPNQGVVDVRNVTLNQNGEDVQVLTTKILLFRRTAESFLKLRIDPSRLRLVILAQARISLWLSGIEERFFASLSNDRKSKRRRKLAGRCFLLQRRTSDTACRAARDM